MVVGHWREGKRLVPRRRENTLKGGDLMHHCMMRTALLAGTVLGFVAAGPVAAQQPTPTATPSAAPAAPPGFSPMDKSNPSASQQDTNLKPHPTPPIATAVDKIPVDKLKLPAGFKAEIWSHGHPGGRTMVEGPKGTIFMGT